MSLSKDCGEHPSELRMLIRRSVLGREAFQVSNEFMQKIFQMAVRGEWRPSLADLRALVCAPGGCLVLIQGLPREERRLLMDCLANDSITIEGAREALKRIFHAAATEEWKGSVEEIEEWIYLVGANPSLARELDADVRAILQDRGCDPRLGRAWDYVKRGVRIWESERTAAAA